MWIAKDLDGSLYIYEFKPEHSGSDTIWYVTGGYYFPISKDSIDFDVKLDEPVEVEIRLK